MKVKEIVIHKDMCLSNSEESKWQYTKELITFWCLVGSSKQLSSCGESLYYAKKE